MRKHYKMLPRTKMHFLVFLFLGIVPFLSFSQQNIAPKATITANGTGGAGCMTGACSTLNDLNFGSCGTQQMWISTSGPPSTTIGADWIQWDFPNPEAFDEIIIHHANDDRRFLSGGLIQVWTGSNWLTHHHFTNLPMACVSSIPFQKVVASRFRITAFEMTQAGQNSNPNFREIEVISAPTAFNDAMVMSTAPDVFCPGSNDIYTTIANYGLNRLNSVQINWEVNGVAMPPVFYGQMLDTLNGAFSNSATVMLGTVNLNPGSNTLKVYTSNPNGSTDGFPLNDTIFVTLQSLTDPTAVSTSNPTTTSIEVDVAGSTSMMQYEYGPRGFIRGNGTVGTAMGNPFTINGLTPSLPYDVYVRNQCDSSYSGWAGPGQFNTECVPVAASYAEDFDGASTATTFTGVACWRATGITKTYVSLLNNANGNAAITPIPTSPNAVGLRGVFISDSALLVSPAFSDMKTGNNRIRFSVAFSDTAAMESLFIGVMSDPDDMHTFVQIDSITAADIGGSYGFEEYELDLTDTALYGNNTHIAFAKGTGSVSRYIYIDDFHYEAIPSCIRPLSISLVNKTQSTAEITWVESHVGTQWEIEYGTRGFTPGRGTRAIVSNDTITLTGLSSATNYDFYVRTICGRNDTSYWRGPLKFSIAGSATGSGIKDTVSSSPPLTASTSTSTNSGISMNVHAYNAINILEMSTRTTASTTGYELWYSLDSINGPPVIDASGGWILHETGTISTVGNPYFIVLNNPLLIPSGETYGIFLRMLGSSIYYASSPSPTVFSDANMRLEVSDAGYSGVPPTPTLHPRAYAGDIVYETAGRKYNDAALKSIDSLSRPCPGSQSIYVTIENKGNNQIDSVEVHWEINGIAQPIVHHKQILDSIQGSLQTSATLFLGNANFNLANNTVKVWTALPNGVLDSNNKNDTIFISGIGAGLAGNYTIDASSPTSSTNYQSFTDAVADLTAFGICGAVSFTISAGIYNESIVLEKIDGAGPNSRVTFDGLNSSQVTVSAGSSAVGTIILDDASYIDIKNMRVENTGINNAAILIGRGSDHNEISNCVLWVAGTTSGSAMPLSFSGAATSTSATGANASYNLVKGNRLVNGYYGIRMYGATGDPAVANRLINNSIDSAYYYGLYTYYTDSLEVIGNNIDMIPGGNGNSYGAYLYYSANSKFISNNVHAQIYGLYFYSFGIPSTSALNRRFEIINNMIISETSYAVYAYYLDSVNIYHNTILNRGTNPAMMIGASSSHESYVDLRNNILVGDGGPALTTNRPAGTMFLHMDHNIYNTEGSNLMTLNNVNYADLPAVQTAFPAYNMNSIEGKPLFMGSNDLHVVGPMANNNGDNSVGITVDIDGDTRPIGNDTIVDIGADEFELMPNDAGVTAIIGGTICPGTVTPVAEVLNYGGNTIDSLEVVISVNGVMDTLYYNTAILSGEKANITLTPQTFVRGQRYDVKIYTQRPNGLVDINNSNDSLIMVGMVTGLAGTYTIDPSQPASASNYHTFSHAVADLNDYGLCGAVTFNVAAGTYNDEVIFEEIKGASSINTITFDGGDSSLTRLVGSAQKVATVVLDETKYLTIKNLGIENLGGENASVLFGPNANHNQILNSELRVARNASGSSVNIAFSGNTTSTTTTGATASYNLIKDNRTMYGYYAVRMYASTSKAAVGNRIIGNKLDSVGYYGVYAYYTDSLDVIGNKIDAKNAASSGSYGGYIYQSLNARFNANKVHAYTYGAYLYANAGATGTSLDRPFEIINNMILTESNIGIYAYYLDSVNIYHNTIYANNAQAALQIYGTASRISRTDLRNNILVSKTGPAIRTNMGTTAMFRKMDHNIYYSGGTALATLDGTTYASFPALQAAFVTLNQNSMEGLPLFESDVDLHARGPLPNNSGDNTVGVLFDIDGDPRPIGTDTIVDIGADEYMIDPKVIYGISVDEPLEISSKCYTTAEDVKVSFSNFGLDSLDFTVDSIHVTVNMTGANVQTVNYTLNSNAANNGIPLAPSDTLSVLVGTVDMTNPGTYNFDVSFAFAGGTVKNGILATYTVEGTAAGKLFGTNSLCLGDSADLFVMNHRGNVQWQVDSNGTFIDIPGATRNSLKTGPVTTTSYRAVTCGSLVSDTMTISPTTPVIPSTTDGLATVTCGSSGQVALTASSPNANAKYEWYTSVTGGTAVRVGGNIARISLSGDTLYYQANPSQGTPAVATFYVQEVVLSGSGICASTRDSATATIDCIVGIGEQTGEATSSISIHPNPSKGAFNIVGSGVKEAVEISIFNSNGKLVYQSANRFVNNFDERIDISGLAKGLYFVKLQSKSSTEMKKVVVQ